MDIFLPILGLLMIMALVVGATIKINTLLREENLMEKVLQRIERRKYIWDRIIPKIAIFVSICSLLVILSYVFNFYGFRDLFQDWDWIEKSFFFYFIISAPIFPGMFYEWYEKIKDSLIETHEFNQKEASMSENEVYLFHTPKVLSYHKKLFRLLRRDY